MLDLEPVDFNEVIKMEETIKGFRSPIDYFKIFKLIGKQIREGHKVLIERMLDIDPSEVTECKPISEDTELKEMVYANYFCQMQYDLCEHRAIEIMYSQITPDLAEAKELEILTKLQAVWANFHEVTKKLLGLHVWINHSRCPENEWGVGIMPKLGLCLLVFKHEDNYATPSQSI